MTLPTDWDWKAPDYSAVYRLRTEALARIRQPGFDLAALKAYYRDHPADFIEDWGLTWDPRLVEIGLPAVVPFLLFPKQRELIDWMRARWLGREDGLVEKCRDIGASWLCVGFAVWMILFHPNSIVGIGSRKEAYVDVLGDPKTLFWKIRAFLNLLPAEFKPVGYDEKKHAPSMRVLNPENGASIIGEAGPNIGRGARTSCYIVDEHAFIENADSVDAALSQTSNCKLFVSTPAGSGNSFYNKRHGGRVKCFVFPWESDPRKDKSWYQKQVETLDAVVLAQEVNRDYTASVTNAFITGNSVTEAQARGPLDVQAIGPLMVGLDVARFGDDKCVLTFRQGRVVYPQVIWDKTDIVDTAGRVKDEILRWPDKPAQIAVDTIGLGAGVADILRRDFGDIVVDVNTAIRLNDGENYNLRARTWRDMRDWVKGGASLPTDPELTTDLTALRYSYRGGLLLIESKEEAKRRGVKSPDRADSIALTFALPPEIAYVAPADSPQWAVLDSMLGY